MKGITNCLWFAKDGLEAAEFYTSLFNDGKIHQVGYYPKEGADVHGQAPGSVMWVEFSFAGQRFAALNGGDIPQGKHNIAYSIMLNCDTQEEIDRYWEALSKNGGQEVECGWLTDRYGISWQIVPSQLHEMITDKDSAKSSRALNAVWKMKKLNLKEIQKAYEGK